MRIAQIPPMRATISHATRIILWLVGSVALSTGLAAGTEPAAGKPSDIRGPAHVMDGDTISIRGARIRLDGIDAPESGQTCPGPSAVQWPCGTEAAAALAQLVEGKSLSCKHRGLDRYGRILAVCHLGDLDVNSWLVRQGYAWAFLRYSASYATEETEARMKRLGIWKGDATPAWEYRAQRWAGVAERAPNGCAIKGNVTARGKIYHMPWSPWYERIRMDPERGRRWFCTEAEALAAGWRPVAAN